MSIFSIEHAPAAIFSLHYWLKKFHHLLMASWGVGESSTFCDNGPIISIWFMILVKMMSKTTILFRHHQHILINPLVKLVKLFNSSFEATLSTIKEYHIE